jgi:hypothetical protein
VIGGKRRILQSCSGIREREARLMEYRNRVSEIESHPEGTPSAPSEVRHEYLQLIEEVLRDWQTFREPKEVLQVLISMRLDGLLALDRRVSQGVTFPLPPGFSEQSYTVEGADGESYTFDLAFFENELVNFQAQLQFSGRDGIDEARRFNATELWQRIEKIAGPERLRPGSEPDSMHCEDLHGVSILAQWVFGCPAVSLWATDRRYR